MNNKNGIPYLTSLKSKPLKSTKEGLRGNKSLLIELQKIKDRKGEFIPIDKKTALYLDVENIGGKTFMNSNYQHLGYISKKKFLCHSNISNPNKINLIQWKEKIVEASPDAADHAIIEEIIEDISKYEYFVLISNDNIFLEVIDELLEKGKKVLLIKSNLAEGYLDRDDLPLTHPNFFFDLLEPAKEKYVPTVYKKDNLFDRIIAKILNFFKRKV